MASSTPTPSTPGQRLSDLARVHPADRTLQNLLGTLSAKLELLGRLPVYEYEAAIEGRDASVIAFRELAEVERRTFNNLLGCLRVQLDEVAQREERRAR